jgi:signal transduction histidine kinase
MLGLFDLVRTGTEILQDNRKRTTVVIVNVMAIIPILFAFVMGPALFAITGRWAAWVCPWIECIILSVVLLLNKKHRYNRAALLVFLIHTFGLLFFSLLLGRAACIEGIAIFMIGFSFLLFPRRKERVLSIAFLIVITLLVELNTVYKVVDHLEFSEAAGNWMFIMIFLAVTFLNIMVLRFYSNDFIEWVSRLEMKSVSKSDFIAKTSHDLRGSVNIIEEILGQLFDPAFPDKKKDVPVSNEQLANLYFSVQDLKLVMNDVLSLNKIEAGASDEVTRSSLKVRDWFNRRVARYQVLGSRRAVRLMCRVEDDVPEYISTDVVKLHRIVINLLTNAIKFTRYDTIVTVRVHLPVSNMLSIDVIDHGEGIEERNLEKIFSPYVSQKNQQAEATGLGLTISRHFAKLLGGTIHVKSTVGKGSTFSLVIPLEKGISANVAPAAPVAQKIAHQDERLPLDVLVIDDDHMVRLITERLLSRMVRSVLVAESLNNGLWLASEKPPNLILLDLNMPGEGRQDMLKKIREQPFLTNVPVIICSADAYEETISEMKQYGADGYIVKPIKSPTELYNEIVRFVPPVNN